ncbi:MAG: hypothetical protein CMK46_06320 [Porticoccus sp.]|nr:hypothetical protein [Porticoccus sp.]
MSSYADVILLFYNGGDQVVFLRGGGRANIEWWDGVSSQNINITSGFPVLSVGLFWLQLDCSGFQLLMIGAWIKNSSTRNLQMG